MKTKEEIEQMREQLAKDYRKDLYDRTIFDWVAVTYTIRTLEWILGIIEDLPAQIIVSVGEENKK